MDEATLKRLHFLVQPAAWAYHESLGDLKADVETAWAEFRDVRLVAAYVLAVACEAAKQAAAAASKGQIKRLESGDDKIEYFQSSSDLLTAASDWCARAQALRDEVARERNFTAAENHTAILDLQTGF